MPELLNQVVLQSLIAALVVEALLRLWNVRSPQHVLNCRLASLGLPLLLLPLFEVLAPWRHADWFVDGPALLASRHLAALTWWGVRVDQLWSWPAWVLGGVLLARDLWPLVASRSTRFLEDDEPPPPALAARVQRLARLAGVRPPRLVWVQSAAPLLLLMGVRSPRLLMTRSLVALLDDDELQAALAHELSHLRHRDVLWTWVVLLLRVGQAVSPVAQVLGRVTTFETELRADAEAATWTGRPAALASALLKVFGTEAPAPRMTALSQHLQRAHTHALEERCRRLLAPAAVEPAPPSSLFAAAALGLVALLFFVT